MRERGSRILQELIRATGPDARPAQAKYWSAVNLNPAPRDKVNWSMRKRGVMDGSPHGSRSCDQLRKREADCGKDRWKDGGYRCARRDLGGAVLGSRLLSAVQWPDRRGRWL